MPRHTSLSCSRLIGLELLSICLTSVLVSSVPIHDFISGLSDRVNEIKRFLIDVHSQARVDITHPIITDPFVSRDPSQVRFLLYNNRNDPEDFVELRRGDFAPFKAANFSKDAPVKFLVHGFNHNSTEGPNAFPHDAKNAYLASTDASVILVDWGVLAKPKLSGLAVDVFYPVVVHNVPRVGEEVGKMMEWMVENDLVSHPDLIHVIGFSLGAHAAGSCGRWFKMKMNRFIGRITGLDPARPMFEHAVEAEKLDKTDADFVDVIHTSRLGLQERMGHVDFYVNGGEFQADCYKLKQGAEPRETVSELYKAIMGTCGHSRAPFYFVTSIKSEAAAIEGCGCSSWEEYLSSCKDKCKGKAVFGEHCSPIARGVFYVKLNADQVTKV